MRGEEDGRGKRLEVPREGTAAVPSDAGVGDSIRMSGKQAECSACRQGSNLKHAIAAC